MKVMALTGRLGVLGLLIPAGEGTGVAAGTATGFRARLCKIKDELVKEETSKVPPRVCQGSNLKQQQI